jgi:hypothetical protein
MARRLVKPCADPGLGSISYSAWYRRQLEFVAIDDLVEIESSAADSSSVRSIVMTERWRC